MWTCCLLLTFQEVDRLQPVGVHLLQSEVLARGPRQRQRRPRLHRPMCSPELHFLSVFMQQEAVTGQEAAPKRRLERSYNPFPKQSTFLLASGLPASPPHVVGEHVLIPQGINTGSSWTTDSSLLKVIQC